MLGGPHGTNLWEDAERVSWTTKAWMGYIPHHWT